MHKQIISERFNCRADFSVVKEAFRGGKEVNYNTYKEALGMGFDVSDVEVRESVKANIRFVGCGDFKVESIEDLKAIVKAIKATISSNVFGEDTKEILSKYSTSIRLVESSGLLTNIKVTTEEGHQFVIPANLATNHLYDVLPDSLKVNGYRISYILGRSVSIQDNGNIRFNASIDKPKYLVEFLDKALAAYQEVNRELANKLETEDK